MSATSRRMTACSKSSGDTFPDRSSASCSVRPPAGCSATCLAGAMFSWCSLDCSPWPQPVWSSNSRSIRRPAKPAAAADAVCSAAMPRAWGAFAYIRAHLHLRFGLSFSLVGGVVACFGIGGLIYAALVKLLVYRLGQARLAVTGGLVLAAAYLALAMGPVWWLAPIATTAIGLGFYMLHNT